jgi:hypothetical protein
VIVRGFDFGTTHQQIGSHMSSVGNIESIDPVLHPNGTVDLGVVRITYSSTEEAKAAVQLQQTCIAGNTRYIDVITLNPHEFLAEQNIEPDKAQQFLGMFPEQQLAVMARGTLSTARDPTAVLVQRMKQAREGGIQGFSAVSGGNMTASSIDGGCSVLVRGFDFNTSDQQIVGHMSRAGTVQNIQLVDKGSVRVTYSTPEEAKMATQLQQTIITGNSRYIDVMLLDPKEFLAPIDPDKAIQFSALTTEQQMAVMAKGSLVSARDPNAVLISRMNQVRQGKGSFGPAGMKGNMGNSPYGGGMGKGGDADSQAMMKQMQMMMMTMMQTMSKSNGNQMDNMANMGNMGNMGSMGNMGNMGNMGHMGNMGNMGSSGAQMQSMEPMAGSFEAQLQAMNGNFGQY